MAAVPVIGITSSRYRGQRRHDGDTRRTCISNELRDSLTCSIWPRRMETASARLLGLALGAGPRRASRPLGASPVASPLPAIDVTTGIRRGQLARIAQDQRLGPGSHAAMPMISRASRKSRSVRHALAGLIVLLRIDRQSVMAQGTSFSAASSASSGFTAVFAASMAVTRSRKNVTSVSATKRPARWRTRRAAVTPSALLDRWSG